MEKVLQSLDDKVDYYLHKISMAPMLRLDPRELYESDVLDEDVYLIDQVMLEKGLIKVDKDARVITSKGLEISNFGGWTLHQRLLQRDRQTRIPREEIVVEKYEEELRQLKNQIITLQNELQLRKDKENSAYRIVHNLTSQTKSDKLYYLIGGIAIGFVLASLISILL